MSVFWPQDNLGNLFWRITSTSKLANHLHGGKKKTFTLVKQGESLLYQQEGGKKQNMGGKCFWANSQSSSVPSWALQVYRKTKLQMCPSSHSFYYEPLWPPFIQKEQEKAQLSSSEPETSNAGNIKEKERCSILSINKTVHLTSLKISLLTWWQGRNSEDEI